MKSFHKTSHFIIILIIFTEIDSRIIPRSNVFQLGMLMLCFLYLSQIPARLCLKMLGLNYNLLKNVYLKFK